MPEGHTVHRLARAFGELFTGEPLAVSSPQGRFAAGAALLDGRVLVASEAWGKQMFLGFAGPGGASDDVRWLRVHLGLYGAWTFAATAAPPSCTRSARPGAGSASARPSRRPGEDAAQRPDDAWSPPPPRGAVRVRLVGTHAVADLTARRRARS
nr:DNA-formamidopyrimidine glycosylase family protein [Cellulosimicrobium sp. MM]